MNLTSELSPLLAVRDLEGVASEQAAQLRLTRIFEDNYRLIWRLLAHLGLDPPAVEDAAQQVFLIVAERLNEVQHGSERSFCYGTALRLASSHRRTRGRETPTEALEHEADLRPNPEQLTEQKRARDVLDRILSCLAEEFRVVFILYELDGFTTPEISELLQIPLGTAASRLRRAREAFRRLVQEENAGHTPNDEGTP